MANGRRIRCESNIYHLVCGGGRANRLFSRTIEIDVDIADSSLRHFPPKGQRSCWRGALWIITCIF